MPKLVREGRSLHYEVHGSGRPVLMLHGICVSFAGNFGMWGWVERLSAGGFQVIGLDFLGHGGSDKSYDASAYGTSNLAADALGLLDHLSIARASVVGYSLGAAVALHLLHAQPERVGPSALVAAGDGFIGQSERSLPVLQAEMREVLSRERFPKDLPPHLAMYWTFATKVGGDRLAALAAASAEYPSCSEDAARKITAPTMVVSGELDPIFGRGAALAGAIPNARYVEVAGADHFMLANDEALQRAIIAFL
jgi:pimeloyl-ACP methyl ester carboxylesterase